MLTTAAQPTSPDARPRHPPRLPPKSPACKARLSELLAGRAGTGLQPVTFVALAAGAHTVVDHPEMVLLTFPVHHEKVVRIALEHAIACQFAESFVRALGGWDAVLARGHRHTKRGCRR
ncbi:MAG: hypothetical protein IPL39_14520 [Opitutaceae bacterium]|nr:hypothetical protein [Opitutaceae bacterium]